MTVVHHPSDIVLAEFANGALDEAAALVVGLHLSQCAACRRAVRRFEALGGSLMAGESTPMLGDAAAVLARLGDDRPARPPAPSQPADASPAADRLLSLYEGDNWRWAGPGIHYRRLSVPTSENIRVFMLKARAGTRLPHHTHTGIEWTCVLEGAFRHAHGRFGPGDFDEASDDVDHDPVVEAGSDCICVVAMTGELKLHGALGRILQPFVRL